MAGSAEGFRIFHTAPEGGTLVQNGGFEEDWYQHDFAQNRRFLLLQTSDIGVDEADGRPDQWTFPNTDATRVWDTDRPHSGSRCLRFTGAGQATQRVRFAGEQNWRKGGAAYAGYLPMDRRLLTQLRKRTLRIGAWCRTTGAPEKSEARLAVTAQCTGRAGVDDLTPAALGAVDRSVFFTGGTHDWEYREIRIESAQLPSVPHWLWISLVGGGGTTWFDDVTCTEEPDSISVNRLPNAGFEGASVSGAPGSWSPAERWNWWRTEYYAFTGWSHARTEPLRGAAVPDPLIAYRGGRSLRMTLYPGDSMSVASAPISLDQTEPHPIEASAMVRADSLRGLELMAQDESGEWLPQSDFLGDDMEDNPGFYDMGTTGAGTYGWREVRKFFSPRRPVRILRLFLCARGFDGVIVEKNRVGLVWWDDVRLVEHGGSPKAPGVAQPPDGPSPLPYLVRDVELGDRLWGKNRLRLSLELPDQPAIKALQEGKPNAQLTGPDGAPGACSAEVEIGRAPTEGKPGAATLTVEYRVDTLCKTWKDQYILTLKLPVPGGKPVTWSIPFGTPSQIVDGGTSAHYVYPNETATLYGHVNVARDSRPDLSRCEISGRIGGTARSFADLKDLSGLSKPQTAPGYIDTNRLVRAQLASAGMTVHPWDDPQLDAQGQVRLFMKTDGGEKLLAESDAIRFGFMQPPPPFVFPTIQKTSVDGRGYLQVNGQPYFAVFWTPHFGIAPEATYPPRVGGAKSVDVTDIVYAKNRAPDAEVKAKLLAKVEQVKNDPKLFQYELGEGEMQLQGSTWRERANWLRTAAAWIREADPNHLINGPEAWLIGHPDHDAAMSAFIPHFDAIGVEASFEEVPKLRQYALPLMKDRHTAVLVGLETYFSQPLHVIRWRGYKSVIEGAAGVGLCPSGMLQARPERENFLRGLNGEFRGLADVITSAEPKQATKVSTPLVEVMERTVGSKRFIIAVRNRDTLGAIKVKFELPTSYKQAKVRFEGRTVPVSSVFEDEFSRPMAVHVYELE